MFHKAVRLLFVFILVFGSVAVQAPTPTRAAGPWYVAPTGDDGNDCLSPGTPCATINGAIGKASSGDTIHVAEGTYTGAGSEVILIDRDVSLSGGWDATFAGQSGTTFVDGETVRRGVTVNPGTTSSLDNFILLNGNKTGGGGGINNSGALTLSNLSISDNRWGIGDGGGIANNQTGVITMNTTTLTRNGNQDLCNGTAIWNQGAITANNSAIFDNQVADIFCGIGSAVINHAGDGYRGSIVLNNSTVSNNSPGGGIYNYGDLTLNNSTVSHNVGDDSNGPGGIYNSVDGILSINSSTIADNTSAGSGGGVFNIGFGTGSVTLQNSIINGNTAPAGADCFGTLNSLGYNLLGNSTDCTFTAADGDLTNVDAKIGILVGSPAYRPLLPDSPAVNAGRPTGCTDHAGNLLAADQRGAARVGVCDMGAYEFTAPGPASSLFIIGGDHRRGLVMSPYSGPFEVTALDSQGSPVEGTTVDFSAPDSGPSGTFADTGTHTTSSITDAGGVAVSSTFTANDQAGFYQVSASAAGAGFAHFQLEQVSRPANDDFTNAEVISTLPFSDTVDITDASKEPGELLFCTGSPEGQSVWYSFTPATTIAVGADMAGSSFGDTNMAVYQSAGPGLEGLSLITSTCFGGSLSFSAQAGNTYYIQAERLFGGGGELHVNLQGFTAPANDNFAGATAITELPFSTVVDNTGATVEPGEPNVCSFPFQSVWYAFSPAEDMTIRITMPVGLGGTVAVFQATGPTIADLTHLTCTFSGSSTNIQLTGGETYYLRVDSFFGQPGLLQFSLEQVTSPANDNFADAASIDSLPFSAGVNNTNATAQTGEPQNCIFPFQSVWYTFTPAEDMAVQVNLEGSQVSGAASIFHATGFGFPGLASLGCAFSNLSANILLEGGETYYFRLDSFGFAGDLQLDIQQILPPANDNFANAQAIGSLPFSASVMNLDATAEPDEPAACGSPYRSVWYSFTVSQDTTARLSISGDNPSGIASLFHAIGPSITDLAFKACAFVGSSTNVQLEAGETYYLRVDSSFGQPGEFQVGLEQIFPPANDNFANAQVIEALPFIDSVDNSNATTETNEPLSCGFSGRSLWYTFTPAEELAVRVSTAGSAVSANLAIFIANGPAITDLALLTCVGSQPRNMVLEGGTTYYLQVDAFGQGGTIQVNVEPLNPPANDNLAAAEPVNDVPFSASVDISDATFEPNESLFCGNSPGTVWYAFQPAETLSLRANMLGSSVDGNVSVLRAGGSGWNGLDFVGCSFGGTVSFVADAGSTYYFQVGSASGQTGTLQFNLVPVAAPPNDNFVNAVEVGSLPFSASIDATDATIEPDEASICTFTPGTVWYSFTPAETVKVRADTQDSPISTNVNIYQATGAGLSGLQFLTCSAFSNVASFLAEARQTYYFQVGGIGQTGPIELNLREVPTISGRVTDASNGSPLPGNADPFAFVQLYRACGENCLEFVNSQNADENGRFSFDTFHFGLPLPASEYEIHVFANLYYQRQFGPFAFSLDSLDVGDLALTPSAILRGRTVDAVSGVPLAGASLTLNRCHDGNCFEFVNSQNTDTDGAFRFNSYYFPEPLAAGTYELLITATGYEPKRLEFTLAEGEDLDLGDVPLDPIPVIGSISGQLVDSLSGAPITPDFTPFVELQLCNPDFCSTVASMMPDGEGRFRFETDAVGSPLPIGQYRILAYADQYETGFSELFEVGEGMHRTVGNVRLVSYPVRFTDIRPCNGIPSAGGECEFSVRVSNGMNRTLSGRAWSMADVNQPGTFIGFSQFQVKDPQDLDLGAGRSKVFRFRLKVPENNTPFEGSICAQVFVGEGAQAYFNTLGNRTLFCVTRSAGGFTIVAPEQIRAPGAAGSQAAASVAEVEPNNSCQMAQDMGVFSDPLTVEGSLDSELAPDIDYYRFSATPGALIAIDHEGQSTGKGTLADPLLGYFDSNCSLIAYNDDSNSLNSHLQITVPDDGVFIMAATTYPDFSFGGGGFGSYEMTVAGIEPIGSISGVVVDAATGNPLPGATAPFAFVHLLYCGEFGCSTVNVQPTGSDGSFHFTTDSGGNLLLNGQYLLVASADQYQEYQADPFTVAGGEDRDLGNIVMQSDPVRFTDIQMCSVPSRGGLCDFSVKVTNGLSARLNGRVWTIVNGSGLDSFLHYTTFQPETTRDIGLAPGGSTIVRFRFQVPAGVPEGAVICATVFVGQNPDPLYNTRGIRTLFCFQKDSSGFTHLSGAEMSEHQQQSLLKWAPANVRPLPKQ